MAQQSFNNLNSKWVSISSPNQQQQGLANYNHTPCFYQTTSPAQNYSNQSPFYYNAQPYYNNSYLATPTMDRTYSSGYASENTSFNSPILKNNYQYYNTNGNITNITPANQYINQDIPKPMKSVKRQREDNQDSVQTNKVNLINQIFEPQESEPVPKKQKRAYNKKKDSVNSQSQSNNLTNQIQDENLLIFDQDLIDDDDYENLAFNLIEGDLSQTDSLTEPRKKRVLTKNQRIAANLRERKRMNIMNESFVKLREVMPITTGRKRRKMSRLDIVVGAIEYIAYLETLLEKEIPGEIDFDAYQNSLYLS